MGLLCSLSDILQYFKLIVCENLLRFFLPAKFASPKNSHFIIYSNLQSLSCLKMSKPTPVPFRANRNGLNFQMTPLSKCHYSCLAHVNCRLHCLELSHYAVCMYKVLMK